MSTNKWAIGIDLGGSKIEVALVNSSGLLHDRLRVPTDSKQGYEIIDMGAYNEEPSDYPDHAANVANALLNNEGELGIFICGCGVGVSVAANKFDGIRAGVCHDTYSAHQITKI